MIEVGRMALLKIANEEDAIEFADFTAAARAVLEACQSVCREPSLVETHEALCSEL